MLPVQKLAIDIFTESYTYNNPSFSLLLLDCLVKYSYEAGDISVK